MTDNIIDGRDRFAAKATGNAVPRSILAIMEEDTSTRIRREDRVTLASNMGDWAAKISPQDPSRVAKRWFDKWDGDRWQKRKKFICFPGEAPRNPAAPGELAASRGDWQALIDAAVHNRFPLAGPAAARDRENLRRTLLRGTKYVPEVQRLSAGDADAQRLMISLTQKICDRMADVHGLDRLWDVLQITPFTVVWAGLNDFDNNGHDDNAIEMASRAASDIRDLVCWFGLERFDKNMLARFGKPFASDPVPDDAEIDWAFPQLRLGLLGFQVDARIFVVPPNVIAQLRAAGDYDIREDDDDLESWISTWLQWKGLIYDDSEDRGAWTLPEVEYTPEVGYGWTQSKYEVVREAWLSCRPKADGKPGLWLSVERGHDSFERCYPILRQIDCLATEAAAPSVLLSSLPFYTSEMGNPHAAGGYGLLRWPDWDPVFTNERGLEVSAPPGLLDLLDGFEGEWGDADDLPSFGGWIDDTSNEELQNTLFRLSPGARFVSSIPTHPNAPPICRTCTIADALLTNLACLPEEQIYFQLADAGERLAEAGLRFHNALMEYYSRLIDLLPDDA